MIRSPALVLVLVACIGCSESTLVRSTPPGASLWVNDRYVGTTPVEYTCKRSDFSRPQRYRLELAGYEPAVGELRKRVMPGRIVGASFCVGISLIFKRPTGFRDRYDFALVPQLPPLAVESPGDGAPER